jgi:ligand-binding SRPBCC domain-containing protein
MTFSITTNVDAHYLAIAERFDLKLFEALAPPFPKVKVLRFDGCHKNSEVHIEMNLFVIKQQWHAVVIEQGESADEWYFIDQGKILPAPLKFWKHRHRILRQTNEKSHIIDEIEYKTGFLLLDYLMYPFFYAQFAARKPIYRKYFSK